MSSKGSTQVARAGHELQGRGMCFKGRARVARAGHECPGRNTGCKGVTRISLTSAVRGQTADRPAPQLAVRGPTADRVSRARYELQGRGMSCKDGT